MGILNEINSRSKKKNIKNIIMVFIISIIIISGIYYYYIKATNKIEIKTYIVSKKDITSNLSADGKVYYKEQYDINFPISGTLLKLYKNEGDSIKAGENIASLDDKYLKINLDKANIVLATANSNLNAKLASKGQIGDLNISRAQLNSSKTTLEANINQGKIEVKTLEDSLISSQRDLENAKKSTQVDYLSSQKAFESAQNDLENVKNNLSTIITQENLNLFNSKQKIQTDIDSIIPQIKSSLKNIDMLIGVTDLNKSFNDHFEVYLGAKNSSTKIEAENSFRIAKYSLDSFESEWKIDNSIKNDTVELFLSVLDNISLAGEKTIETLRNSIVSSTYNQSTLDSQTNGILQDLLSTKTNISKIILDEQAIKNTQTNFDNKVSNQNDIINSYELKLEIAKINYDKVIINNKNIIDSALQKITNSQNQLATAKTKLQANINLANSQIGISQANLDYKTDSFDPRELEPYKVSIESTKKGVEEAKQKIIDATIFSPIDGKIGKLTQTKIGTQINQNPTNAFVTIINKGTVYVEARIEEGDISNISLGQKTNIKFNSLENIEVEGKVSYISDKAETDINGIVTYKVEIRFNKIIPEIKEGYTTQIYFVLEEKKQILSLPIELIKDENDKKFVNLKTGKKLEIKTGIEDGDYIEIISGLKEGDEVIN
ncbi:MAG: HlyD family efflux transporter periplasmic adaptor subunit [Candidatus Gracilibacteria bacterium]|nr:HlyD family efflux transporter periplasmic adaptor subunit [Candidatus Gracilibacteria bacterium]MDD2908943.1 HlyD family efflux transporter periplasmic adaptor subunit [Candidatus Gracilibacteria bacterium]